jgi:hypothetical protein
LFSGLKFINTRGQTAIEAAALNEGWNMNHRQRAALITIFTSTFCSFTAAQKEPDWQMVLATETIMIAARINQEELIDGRYVHAQGQQINDMGKDGLRSTSITSYIFDCQEPKKVALLQTHFVIHKSTSAMM